MSKFLILAYAALFTACGSVFVAVDSEPTLARKVAKNTQISAIDKHQQHFELLQSKLKHGHRDALYFILNYSRIAEQLGKAYDITPEIILAVGILESSSGTSNIAACARNYHGIKAGDNWGGLTFTCENGKVWRAWNSPAEGLEGFCQYVCDRMPHLVGKNITPAEFAYAYGSRDPKRYTEQLHSIIARYGLKTLFG